MEKLAKSLESIHLHFTFSLSYYGLTSLPYAPPKELHSRNTTTLHSDSTVTPQYSEGDTPRFEAVHRANKTVHCEESSPYNQDLV